MTIITLVLGLAGESLFIPLVCAQPLSHQSDVARLEPFIQQQMDIANIPGLVIGIVNGTGITYLEGYGMADASHEMTPQTPCIIGSLSKSFTGLAIMQLVERGILELDTSVQDYLPWFTLQDPQATRTITIRQLLYQNSGLPGRVGNRFTHPDFSLEQQVRSYTSVSINRPIGSRFEYSNVNYILLGMLVQEVSGQSYGQYIQDHIFTPLNMLNSFTSQVEAETHGLAVGHRVWFRRPMAESDLPYFSNMLPAASVIASAEDLCHYLPALLQGGKFQNISLLSSTRIEQLFQPGIEAEFNGFPGHYAMGWHITTMHGETVLWHQGGYPHFTAYMFLLPERQWGGVILMNMFQLFSNEHVEALVPNTISILLGKSSIIPEPNPKYFIFLGLTLLLICGQCARICRFVFRWKHQKSRLALLNKLKIMLFAVGFPLLLDSLLIVCLTILLPRMWGMYLSSMMLFVPDLTLLLYVLIGLLIGWAVMRTLFKVRGCLKF